MTYVNRFLNQHAYGGLDGYTFGLNINILPIFDTVKIFALVLE